MHISHTIKEYLDKEHVNYEVLEHDLAFTAMEVAEAQHEPGRRVVKSIIVIVDGKRMMCVLPATQRIDFKKFKEIFHANKVELASEGMVASLFPQYEVGAMPPFGHLVGLKLYADSSLKENESIAFNAGSHTAMLRIKFQDFVRLTDPVFADFGVHI